MVNTYRHIFLDFRNTMNLQDCYKIGLIAKPHGLKGEVNVLIEEGTPLDFTVLDAVFVLLKDQLVPLFIETSSVKGNKAYVKFEDINTVEEAESISKSPLYLPKKVRPKQASNEFYDDEIINFIVEDEEAGIIGNVIEVAHSGPQRLLVVQREAGEVLIPVNAPFIKEIKRSAKKIVVLLPDGLLEI